MRAAGVIKRPYVLRAYAETQFTIAESKGKISHQYLQFLAGHKGDIEARYSTEKGRLPPPMIAGMRQQYQDCEPFLGTTSNIDESSVVKEAKLEALKLVAKNILGMDPASATFYQIDVSSMPAEEKLKIYEEEIEKHKAKQLTLEEDPKSIRADSSKKAS